MILWLLGCASFWGPNLHTVHFASRNKNHEKLAELLGTAEYSYVRERSAIALREAYMQSPSPVALQGLRKCLRKQSERSYVRAQCALTLASWGINSTAEEIFTAIKQVDPESRYLMVVALKKLSSEATKPYLQELLDSKDMYISVLVREAN